MLEERRGPAAARNAGARIARGNVLMFVDADVLLPGDAVARVVAALAGPPRCDAVIGSYDDAPEAPNFLSQYKNLAHHFVHQTSHEDACTFWSACGAVRREVVRARRGIRRAIPAAQHRGHRAGLTAPGRRQPHPARQIAPGDAPEALDARGAPAHGHRRPRHTLDAPDPEDRAHAQRPQPAMVGPPGCRRGVRALASRWPRRVWLPWALLAAVLLAALEVLIDARLARFFLRVRGPVFRRTSPRVAVGALPVLRRRVRGRLRPPRGGRLRSPCPAPPRQPLRRLPTRSSGERRGPPSWLPGAGPAGLAAASSPVGRRRRGAGLRAGRARSAAWPAPRPTRATGSTSAATASSPACPKSSGCGRRHSGRTSSRSRDCRGFSTGPVLRLSDQPRQRRAQPGPRGRAPALLPATSGRACPGRRTEQTLEAWVTNRFGRRLYETFFKTYTEKVWGMPCSEIRADWAAQRIRGLSLRTAVCRRARQAPARGVADPRVPLPAPRRRPDVGAPGGPIVAAGGTVRLETTGHPRAPRRQAGEPRRDHAAAARHGRSR